MGHLTNILKDLFGGLLNRKADPERMRAFHKQMAEGIFASWWIKQSDEPQPLELLGLLVSHGNPSQLDQLEADCRKKIKLGPNDATLYNNLGFILLKQSRFVEGKSTESEAAYRKALQIQSNNAEIHNNFGAALINQDRFAEAEVEFRESVWLDPNNCSYRKNLGRAFFLQGKLKEAEAEYMGVLKFTDYDHTATGTEEILREIRAELKS